MLFQHSVLPRDFHSCNYISVYLFYVCPLARLPNNKEKMYSVFSMPVLGTEGSQYLFEDPCEGLIFISQFSCHSNPKVNVGTTLQGGKWSLEGLSTLPKALTAILKTWTQVLSPEPIRALHYSTSSTYQQTDKFITFCPILILNMVKLIGNIHISNKCTNLFSLLFINNPTQGTKISVLRSILHCLLINRKIIAWV